LLPQEQGGFTINSKLGIDSIRGKGKRGGGLIYGNTGGGTRGGSASSTKFKRTRILPTMRTFLEARVWEESGGHGGGGKWFSEKTKGYRTNYHNPAGRY